MRSRATTKLALAVAGVAAGLIPAGVSSAAVLVGDELTLSGTIRDFKGVNNTGGTIPNIHPDFDQFDFGPLLDFQENPVFPPPPGLIGSVPGQYLPAIPIVNPGGQDQTTKVEPNIVDDDLNVVDNKPVFSTTGRDPLLFDSTSDATNFNQWFNDTVGVNLSAPLDLKLANVGGNKFAFRADRTSDTQDGDNDGGFFPIDGLLGGNDGADRNGTPHNYSFTLEIHDTLTYVAGAGQEFKFEGDDDLWLFLNNKRVIDLGGVHNVLVQTINLDTLAAQLSLVNGASVKFDLFYAERNQFNSDLLIETNFFTVAPPGDDDDDDDDDDDGGPDPIIPLPAAAWMALSTLAGLGGAVGLRKRLRKA